MRNGFGPALHWLLRRLLTEPQPPAAVRASPRAPWFAVATVCVGAFMGQLDASIVTAALPQLAHNLRATVGAVEWVSLVYSLVLASTVVTVGHIADAAGRKLLYLGGFLVFTASSAVCGLAPTLTVLIGARLVQALGAAMLQANSFALISEAIPKPLLGRAIGWQSLAQSLGLGLGPAVGGALLSFLGWRWLFWVNLPAGALGLGLGWVLLPASSSRRRPELGDGLGALLLALGTGLPLIYVSLADSVGYANGALMAALGGGVLFTVWFVIHERRSDEPLIDLSMFRHPALSAGLGSGLVSYTVLFGTLSGVSYYLAGDRVSSWAAGIQLAALPLALGITAPIAGHRVSHTASIRQRRGSYRLATAGSSLTRRFASRARRVRPRGGTRRLTTAGFILICAGLVEVVLWHRLPGLLAGLAIAGIGHGLFTPANNTGIVRAAPGGRSALTGGVINMTRSIGTALGVALASLLYSTATGSARGQTRQATIARAGGGLTMTLATLAVMVGLGGCLLFVLPAGRRGRRTARGDSRPELDDIRTLSDRGAEHSDP